MCLSYVICHIDRLGLICVCRIDRLGLICLLLYDAQCGPEVTRMRLQEVSICMCWVICDLYTVQIYTNRMIYVLYTVYCIGYILIGCFI
jgi:hypothetical protein